MFDAGKLKLLNITKCQKRKKWKETDRNPYLYTYTHIVRKKMKKCLIFFK